MDKAVSSDSSGNPEPLGLIASFLTIATFYAALMSLAHQMAYFYALDPNANIVAVLTREDLLNSLLAWLPFGSWTLALFASLLATRRHKSIRRWAILSGSLFFGALVVLWSDHGLKHSHDARIPLVLGVGLIASLTTVFLGRTDRLDPISLAVLAAIGLACVAAGYGFRDGEQANLRADIHFLDPYAQECFLGDIENGHLVRTRGGVVEFRPWADGDRKEPSCFRAG